MDVPFLFESLRAFPPALAAAAAGIDDERARQRPAEGAWAPVEIVRHLLDEERRDFLPRIERTLAGEAWEPIDPEGWAAGGAYLADSLAAALRDLEQERARSLARLGALTDAAWSRAHDHALLGTLTAGDLLASWAAHDALHLAQLARARVALVAAAARPHGVRYATG